MATAQMIEGNGSHAEWRMALLGMLEAPQAARVCTTQDLAMMVRRVRPRATPDTVHSAIDGLTQARAVQKVSRGLYLNQRCVPAAGTAEAAGHLRAGAVVSLESVLGECGFLNNPPAVVTAVLAQANDLSPKVGFVQTSGGQVFRFKALPRKYFPQGESDERLLLQAGRHCAMARPEVALLHWMHLWCSPRSSMGKPPQDVDFSVLDDELLQRLALKWDLAGALARWRQEVARAGDVQEPADRDGAPSRGQVQQGQAARERLLGKARRG